MKASGRIDFSWSPEERRPDNAEELEALVEHATDSAYGSVRLGWTMDGWRVDGACLSETQVFSGADKLSGPQNMRQQVHELLAKAGLPMAPWPY